MNFFQSKNEARTGAALQVESQVWEDLNTVPGNNMGIVPMPSDKFIYDYSLAHPDTIQLGKRMALLHYILAHIYHEERWLIKICPVSHCIDDN